MLATLLTFNHCNVGGYLFEESVRKIFLEKYDSLIEIKNDELIQGELLDKVNKSKAIIIAGGPIIGNIGAYSKCWMGFIKLNPDLSLIKVPIILFGVGLISIPFENELHEKMDKLHSPSIHFLNKVNAIYTRDRLTSRYLDLHNIQNKFMGCPSLIYNNTDSLLSNTSTFDTILFSPSIKLNNEDIELYNKIKSWNVKVIVCINHNDSGLQRKAATLFNTKIINLTNVEQMIKINTEASLHIGYRVHQHISCLLAGVKSILVVCDNRGLGMTEVLGNNKYSVETIKDLDNKINSLRYDDYTDIYNDIENIRVNIRKNIDEIYNK